MDFGMELFPLFLVIFRQWQGRESPKYLRYEFLLAFFEYMFYNILERIFELGGEKSDNACIIVVHLWMYRPQKLLRERRVRRPWPRPVDYEPRCRGRIPLRQYDSRIHLVASYCVPPLHCGPV